MAVALVAVAANLRIAITSVPPLLDAISSGPRPEPRRGRGADDSAGPLHGCLRARREPDRRTAPARRPPSSGPSSASSSGTASRFAGDHVVVLYTGTFVCGVGIAVAGTLLPRLVKTYFPPERTGLVTGLYMLAMMGGAALSSAIAVPLADRLGSWQASLGSWSVVALVGALAWAPFTVRANPHHTPDEEGPGRLPWGHPTAWLVAGYLALQSWCFYSAVTWLAPTYVEHGWSP